MKTNYFRYYFKLFIMMMIFWLLLSGRLELKFILYGVVSSLICSRICLPLLTVRGRSGQEYFAFDVPVVQMAGYCLWIFWQLILSNVSLASAVMRPELGIDPRVIRFQVNMDNPIALTVLANSITLTPGTVTVNVTDDAVFEIHALTEDAASGIIAGDMQIRVARLFKQDEHFTVLETAMDPGEAAASAAADMSGKAGSLFCSKEGKEER